MSLGMRDIPGYYYDTEKGKYFKIQTNAPSHSAYSFHDVKRRKIENEAQQAQDLVSRRLVGRISRSRILAAPLMGGFLFREFGDNALGNTTSTIYSRNLARMGNTTIGYPILFAVAPVNLNASLVEVSMSCNADLRQFIVNCNPRSKIRDPWVVEFNTQWHPYSNTRGGINIFGHGQSTSLSINEAHGRIATTWLSNTAAGIAVTSVRAAADEERGFENGHQILGPGREEVSIYSSVSAPPSSQYLFAVGTSDGILLVDKEISAAWISPERSSHSSHNHDSPRDVFALEFLHENPSILLSGGRNGILNITDLRFPKYGPQADTIMHQSSITHIKSMDEHRVLVAGLNSSLCQYDLRFRKSRPISFQENSHQQGKGKGKKRRAPTFPCLDYPGYKNEAQISIGFDVDLELGIIAAAQDYDSRINLFSLHGSHILKSRPAHSKNGDTRYIDSTVCKGSRCLKFVQDTSNNPKSIWVTDETSLSRWAWDHGD